MNLFKKMICFVLSIINVLMLIPFVSFNSNAAEAEYYVGDIIQFGTYPQEYIENRELINEILQTDPIWTEEFKYNYYPENGWQGKYILKKELEYKYCDYESQGEKYRLVCYCEYNSAVGRDETEYFLFKFTPIEWRVLDPTTGLLLSEKILYKTYYSIDFPKTAYPKLYYYPDDNKNSIDSFLEAATISCKYDNSYVRQWLNENFYNTAFSDEEKENVKKTLIDNSEHDRTYSEKDSQSTEDKVFLLSVKDMINKEYGFDFDTDFEDSNRVAQPTEYATFYDGIFHQVDYPSHGERYILRCADYCGATVHFGTSSSFNLGGTREFSQDQLPKTYTDYIRPAINISELSDISYNVETNDSGSEPIASDKEVKNKSFVTAIAMIVVTIGLLIVFVIIIKKKYNK